MYVLISKILATSGLVEHVGQGMNMMYEECIKEAKNLPDYSQSGGYLVRLVLNGTITDKSFLVFQKHIPEEQYASLTTEDLLTLNAVCHQFFIPSELRSRVSVLRDLGLLEKAGMGVYKLSAAYDEISLQSGESVKPVLQTDDEYKQAILELINSAREAGVKRSEIENAISSRTQRQLRVLLKEMSNEGFIMGRGNGNGARWYPK